MNTSERDQLAQFLQQLTQAQAGAKDAEAQSLISRATAQQPDAAYLLVQRALLQDGAIQVANERIAALEAELNQLKTPARSSGGGFLDAIGWGRAPVPNAPAPSSASSYAPSQASQQVASAPAYYPPAAPVAPAAAPGFQAPSFLTSMATTAAGVAAGAFLFQGIGHLMGSGHQGTGASAFGLGGPQAFDGQNGTPQTEVINNYFDKSPSADSNLGVDTSDRFLDASSSGDGFDGVDLDPNNDWT